MGVSGELGSARALAQTVISLIAEKPSPQEVVYRVDSNGSGLKLSPGTAVPGSPGVWLTSCRVSGPGEKLLYFRVCLASRARRLGSGADGNFSDYRKTFPPGGGLPGKLKRFRVETKPGHGSARLAGVWLTSCRVNGPVEKPLYWWVCLDRGRENRLVSVPPPSEPDWRFSRIRLSG